MNEITVRTGDSFRIIFLSTLSLQAPEFYLRKAYEEVARIDDHPLGHASIFFAKRLDAP